MTEPITKNKIKTSIPHYTPKISTLPVFLPLDYNSGMKELGRRGFIKIAGIGAAATGAILIGRETFNQFEGFGNYLTSLDYLDGVKSPPHPLPEPLKGVTLNSPFLWQRDDDYIKWVGGQAEKLGAQTIRIFINDEFEPKLGRENYNDKVLENIKKITTILPGTKLIVSLFDTYSLLHSDKPNLDYPPSPLSSPYFLDSRGKTREEKQNLFFTDGKTKSIFSERLDHCTSYLKDVEEIAAWEIANEPELNNKEVLTSWYKDSIDVVGKVDSARPIITGLAKPFLIDESKLLGINAINSFHAYPLNLDVLKVLMQHSSKSLLPLAGLETGIGKRLKPVIDLPLFIYLVFRSVISENTLYSGNIGLWKIDDYEDGYDVSDLIYSNYLQDLSERLRSI